MNENLNDFISSITEEDLEDEELLDRSSKFFSENISELDAEFSNNLLALKASGKAPGVEFIEKYAYRGSPAAQVAVGTLMLEGKGVEKNTTEGIFWLKRAFANDNPLSGFVLAGVYINGNVVKENFAKAREYLRGSADLGAPRSQFWYAEMLLSGKGGVVDEELGIQYMRIAAENGNENAIAFLEENDL